MTTQLKKYYCETCDRRVDSHIESREQEFPVKGEPTQVCSKVRICDRCGGVIFDEELDSASLLSAFDIYRKKHGIISPGEVLSLREKYGLSQLGLATLLGWGEVTIHRYEAGSIADEAHSQFLRLLLDKPENMVSIFERNRGRLPLSSQRKVEARLDEIFSGGVAEPCGHSLYGSLARHPVGLLTGYRAWSKEILEAMIVFFASQPGGVLKTKLNKLLFYADFTHFKQHTVSISGATYVHATYGPVPDNYESLLGAMIDNGTIEVNEEYYAKDKHPGIKLTARDGAEVRSLPDTALPVLQAVHDHFRNLGSKAISDVSHQEPGYLETTTGNPISYNYADSLRENICIPPGGEV